MATHTFAKAVLAARDGLTILRGYLTHEADVALAVVREGPATLVVLHPGTALAAPARIVHLAAGAVVESRSRALLRETHAAL